MEQHDSSHDLTMQEPAFSHKLPSFSEYSPAKQNLRTELISIIRVIPTAESIRSLKPAPV
ncbi:hypothetical protein Plim_0277 [Planctopirus limnophila DSM 3776]|uniref:Uncharacterized protein n=1 Tax=Planctopirus limnophila (strain ATCC 43296 / DSM 3776 / IFAM 1008 / Mu 290) TaxID=521674 RepID=D5SNX3_PLAL2|nr:hypothetical protein Plim_0277 [Planctopirus limnophila DSM 3776]